MNVKHLFRLNEGHLLGGAMAAFLLIVGCARQPEMVYTSSAALLELPAMHQEQIQQAMRMYFGTPSRPMLPQLTEVESDRQAEGEAAPLSAAERREFERLEHGAQVYQLRCAGCHGITGDGKGAAAAYLNPKPRDYRRGIFKFTSTPYGSKPRRSDLIRTIRKGAKGTSMPGFPWLSDKDVEAVVDYVILLSQRGETEGMLVYEAEDFDEDEELDAELFAEVLADVGDSWKEAGGQLVLPMTPMPERTEETVRLGYEAFQTQGCAKCHGPDGRGHTQDNVGTDAWGNTVKAADLTAGMLHGGRRPVDVYRRIYSGINGTPMPAFSQQLSGTPDTLWHLVHFILSIVDGSDFGGSAQVPAGQPETPAADEPVSEAA